MNGSYVFISYSRKHYYVAEQIAASLRQNGLPAWLDVQEIDPGVDWQAAISQGIADCQAFVLVASRAAYRSPAVRSEIAAAQKAGKPIYLALIENCPFMKQLRDSASIVDCRFDVYKKVAELAGAIQSGPTPHDPVQRWRPLSDTMPFGRAKYLQLLFVALCYTVGTITFIIDKQVIIHYALPQQLIALLVIITVAATAWLFALFYSWRLVFAFRRQRHVSFAELEIWPIINLVLFPVLFFALDDGLLIQLTGEQKQLNQGTYLTHYLTLQDRFGAGSLVFSLLVLVPYAFVLLSRLQTLLILFCASFAFLIVAIIPMPLLLRISIFGVLVCILLTILLWDFFRGDAVQKAFNGDDTLPNEALSFALIFCVAAFIDIPIWFLLPVYITFRLLIVLAVSFAVLRICLPRILLQTEGESFGETIRLGRQMTPIRIQRAPTKEVIKAGRQWAKWLTPSAFITEKFNSLDDSSWHRVSPGRSSGDVTWSVQYAAADADPAREIRQAFAQDTALHEVDPQQAQYHLIVISNTTPRRWIAEQEARYPKGICVITAPVDITALGMSLQQNQWVDYRLRQPEPLRYLAGALAGKQGYANPTLPEDLRRSRVPYPVRLVGHGLRVMGAMHIILGIAALSVLRLIAAPQLAYPLIAISLILGVWCFWEAERLQMRRTTLAMLLLTTIASIGMLGYWLFSGALGVLAPHNLFVQNGDINGRVAGGIALAFVLAGPPAVLFVLAAMVEMGRNLAILQRWLPGITWPTWRRTLGIATWRNITPSYGVYGVGIVLAAALISANSPFHFPRFREFDLPGTDFHAQLLTLDPGGNVWFESSNSSLGDSLAGYQIGYITPDGDLHAEYYSLPQPKDCSGTNLFGCVTGADLHLGPDRSLWFATSQGSFDENVFIVRITPDGKIHKFPLASHTFIPNMRLAFDAAGNLWYTRQTPLSLTEEKDAIGMIDATNHIHEFPLPDNSAPTALVSGPDGDVWVALEDAAVIGRVAPDGTMTRFTLPKGIKPEEMIVGPDGDMWFTAPDSSAIGHITVAGKATIIPLPAGSIPVDLTVSANRSIWYIDYHNLLQSGSIGRVTVSGSVSVYHISALFDTGSTLTATPDGTMWLTLYNQIGHIMPDGTVTLYDAPTLDADLGEMILGADGRHLWFSEYTGVLGEFSL